MERKTIEQVKKEFLEILDKGWDIYYNEVDTIGHYKARENYWRYVLKYVDKYTTNSMSLFINGLLRCKLNELYSDLLDDTVDDLVGDLFVNFWDTLENNTITDNVYSIKGHDLTKVKRKIIVLNNLYNLKLNDDFIEKCSIKYGNNIIENYNIRVYKNGKITIKSVL